MCPSAAKIKSAISLFSELAVKFQLTCSLSTKKYSTQKKVKDVKMQAEYRLFRKSQLFFL